MTVTEEQLRALCQEFGYPEPGPNLITSALSNGLSESELRHRFLVMAKISGGDEVVPQWEKAIQQAAVYSMTEAETAYKEALRRGHEHHNVPPQHNSVYVLERWGDHEAGWIQGVFASLEAAMAGADEWDEGAWTTYEATKDRPQPRWQRGEWEGQSIEQWEVAPRSAGIP